MSVRGILGARPRRIVRTLSAPLALAAIASGCSGSPALEPEALSDPSSALAACGDGTVQAGEECDDANADDGDGCLATCYRALDWISGDPHLHAHGCASCTGCSRPSFSNPSSVLCVSASLR